MKILDTNTPIKIKHIVIVILLAGLVLFFRGWYKQTKINSANIQAIAVFLQETQQAKVTPKVVKPPEKNDNKTETP